MSVRYPRNHTPRWADDLEAKQLRPHNTRTFSQRCSGLCLATIRFLAPSFLQPQEWTYDAAPATPKLEPEHPKTAWLNGLRGIAALFVVIHHSTLLLFSWDIHRAYRSPSDHILQLPILRLAISGLPQVCIFFVVSGYSISLTSLSHILGGRHDAIQSTLASSLARRHSRLFVPAVSVALVSALASYWGWFADEDWSSVPAFASRLVPRDDFLGRQLWDWARRSVKHADPMQNSIHDTKGFPYDVDQWTIPLEFAGSMVVYLLLLALSRLRPWLRLSVVVGVMAWQVFVSASWVVFLFVGGMFLAEVDLHFSRRRGETRSYLPGHSWKAHPAVQIPLWTIPLLLSLYLLSAPEISLGPKDGLAAPGYQLLQSLIPKTYWAQQKPDYFLIPVGAFILVLCLSRCHPLQWPFTTPLALYLGRISYSLYLVHGPLLYTYGAWLARRAATAIEGPEEQAGSGLTHAAVVYVAFWPVVIWCADVVCQGIDEPVVRGLRVMYRRVTREER